MGKKIILLLFFATTFFMSTFPMKKKKWKRKSRRYRNSFTLKRSKPKKNNPKVRKTISNENLFKAAQQGDEKGFICLLEQASTNINYQDELTGQTVVHVAAKKGNLKLLKKIFGNERKKYRLRIQDNLGRTAFQCALENELEDPEIVKLFLQQEGILDVLREIDFAKICKKLIVVVPDTEIYDVYEGFKKWISLLLQKKQLYDTTSSYRTSETYKYFHKFLQENRSGDTTFPENEYISGEGKYTHEHPILKHEIFDLPKWSLFLLKIVRLGYFDLANYILKTAEIDLNSLIDFPKSLLHIAVKKNFANIVRLLLLHGINPNSANNPTSITPLHLAVKKGLLPIVKILVEAGANLAAKDSIGLTPVDIAGVMEHQEVLKYLLKHQKSALK